MAPSAPQVTRRRRQRSARVTAAIGLIVLAALVVTAAALTGSWLLVTVAGALGVLLGAAATRIVHSELLANRVTSLRERAAQALAYNHLNDLRSSEHAAYVSDLRTQLLGQIAEKEEALAQLESALGSAQRRAASATRKHNAEVRRAAGLQVRLTDAEDRAEASGLRAAELEHELTALRAELATVTTAWHAAEHHRRDAS